MHGYITRLPDHEEFPEFPRRLVLLGSTGSIGTSACQVIRRHPERFRVLALAGARNARLLAEQAVEFRPPHLACLTDAVADELRTLLPTDYSPEITTGPGAYAALAALDDADMVLSSIVGAAGLTPTFAAVRAGRFIALANKEALVLAGHLIRREAAASGAVILPVDSEHNALFQSAVGQNLEEAVELVLTASGGPFRGRSRDELASVTREQALNHPNWSMGAKITIDSATLMNKGLEVIEACHLYGMGEERVKTVVHPQSIVHSLVHYRDGSMLAQLGPPDMRIAIAYAMGYPNRLDLGMKPLDLALAGSLTFEEPDLDVFVCLRLAREAFKAGESHPIVLNAANEVAVELFLKERIGFLDIPATIEQALEAHTARAVDDLESVLALDAEVRRAVRDKLGA